MGNRLHKKPLERPSQTPPLTNDKQTEINNNNTAIGNKETDIRNKEGEITAKQGEITATNNSIAMCEKLIADYEKDIAVRTNANATIGARKTSLTNSTIVEQQKIEALNDQIATTFEFRMHDTRIGRFWSVDPLAGKFPWNSSYAFAENRVVDGRELEGLEVAPPSIGIQTFANNINERCLRVDKAAFHCRA